MTYVFRLITMNENLMQQKLMKEHVRRENENKNAHYDQNSRKEA